MYTLLKLIEHYNDNGNDLMVGMLLIQLKQFELYKRRLNKKYIKALENKLIKENSKLKNDSNPYSVFRGASMDNFISNTHI